MYISHISDDGRQEEVAEHLREVSEMAADFARPFGAESWAAAAGALHDIGKCSEGFQRKILDGGKAVVDHSTAGAVELLKREDTRMLAFVVAGHHVGLPDGGAASDTSDKATLTGRLKKAREGLVETCHWAGDAGEVAPPLLASAQEADGFTETFLTRMVFSCLVDADYLCTERFMRGAEREGFAKAGLAELCRRLEDYLDGLEADDSCVNEVRRSVSDMCRQKAAGKAGIYSLTVPTGGGKTLASLRFALHHALEHREKMRRVIYAAPYTSVIGQTAQVFREVLGEDAVLEHHSAFDFANASDDAELNKKLELASENWDAEVVVTTNVQLFESLYAAKPGRCRKLHNIAGSVIVLDEAQMLPTGCLRPCVRALAELVENYGCSVVLCTATQPALAGLFAEAGHEVVEIAEDVEESFEKLRRVSYVDEGRLRDSELAERLAACKQALCVVNNRRQARAVYELAVSQLGSAEGLYHLSTFMHPAHRAEVIESIRKRLEQGLPCRVVSTSLVECGVDVSFPTVYRALAGVDSIVQCAGRCNREGDAPAEASTVRVFEAADDDGRAWPVPDEIAHRAALSRSVMGWRAEDGLEYDFGSLDAVEEYFTQLIRHAQSLDAVDAVARLSKRTLNKEGVPAVPFASVAKEFVFINENTSLVVVGCPSIEDDIKLVREGKFSRGARRRLSRYGVEVYDRDAAALCASGALEYLCEGVYLLADKDLYRDDTGLETADTGGRGLFF